MTINVRIGFREINEGMKGLRYAHQTKQSAIAQLKKEMLIELQRVCPKDTGKYSKSWKIKRATKYTFSFATNQKKLFNILEYTGSRPHIIRAVKAQYLHWVDKATGKDMFRKSVKHPGFKARPHVRPFVDKAVPKMRARILKELKSRNRWLK